MENVNSRLYRRIFSENNVLKCSANNKAETVLELFLDAVKRDGKFGLRECE